jgi:hypothetical protein
MKPFLTFFLFLCLLTACAAPTAVPTQTAPAATEAEGWAGFQSHMAYPFGQPLPPAEPSPLDGTYVKVDPDPNTPVPCMRCPDYIRNGGLWLLRFHEGVFRIYHPITGWKSLGSFTVAGDTLQLFNDPNCTDVVGQYTWALEDGVLTLALVDDPCAIRLRAKNFTFQPWESCQPPNQEAAITGHWPVPAGCEDLEQ